jgi:hypothetical protein
MKTIGVLFLLVSLVILVSGSTFIFQEATDEAHSDEVLHPSDPNVSSGINTTEDVFTGMYELYYILPFVLLIMLMLAIYGMFKYIL